MTIEGLTDKHDEQGWERMRLAPSESHALMEWLTDHFRHCVDANEYIVIAQGHTSGIGTNTVVRCTCDEGKDITDYGLW